MHACLCVCVCARCAGALVCLLMPRHAGAPQCPCPGPRVTPVPLVTDPHPLLAPQARSQPLCLVLIRGFLSVKQSRGQGRGALPFLCAPGGPLRSPSCLASPATAPPFPTSVLPSSVPIPKGHNCKLVLPVSPPRTALQSGVGHQPCMGPCTAPVPDVVPPPVSPPGYLSPGSRLRKRPPACGWARVLLGLTWVSPICGFDGCREDPTGILAPHGAREIPGRRAAWAPGTRKGHEGHRSHQTFRGGGTHGPPPGDPWVLGAGDGQHWVPTSIPQCCTGTEWSSGRVGPSVCPPP